MDEETIASLLTEEFRAKIPRLEAYFKAHFEKYPFSEEYHPPSSTFTSSRSCSPTGLLSPTPSSRAQSALPQPQIATTVTSDAHPASSARDISLTHPATTQSENQPSSSKRVQIYHPQRIVTTRSKALANTTFYELDHSGRVATTSPNLTAQIPTPTRQRRGELACSYHFSYEADLM